MIKSKWELSKSDKQIIEYCKSKGYKVFLARELVGGNVYNIKVHDELNVNFKNDSYFLPNTAVLQLKLHIKLMLQYHGIKEAK